MTDQDTSKNLLSSLKDSKLI